VAVAVEPRRTAIQRTHRALLVILAALLLVLLVTGLWLVFRYQPSGSFVEARPQSVLRVTHRVTSTLFLLVAIATFGLSIAVSFERALKRGTPAWAVGLVVVLGALAASFTGYLLPWDQLALALAPVRGAEYRGYGFLFGHSEVRFVLVGSVEVTKDTVRTWFFVHAVAIPVALAVLGVVGLRVTRHGRVLPPTDPPEG
jgi:quinol-cytochrome oxidoreductase complex cytochrome b subunit